MVNIINLYEIIFSALIYNVNQRAVAEHGVRIYVQGYAEIESFVPVLQLTLQKWTTFALTNLLS